MKSIPSDEETRYEALTFFFLALSALSPLAAAPAAGGGDQQRLVKLFQASRVEYPESFEVITIKPSAPTGGVLGFYGYPGGRVKLGNATVKTLISYAFDVQEFQVEGGPSWAGTDRYDVVALPPDSSPSRHAIQPSVTGHPTAEQQAMLQTLLIDRFNLKSHIETKKGSVFLLVRGKGKLALQEPKDKTAGPGGGVFMSPDGTADGEAAGVNVSMPLLAKELSLELDRPVIDETGLKGSFDFHIPPFDPSNRDGHRGDVAARAQTEKLDGPDHDRRDRLRSASHGQLNFSSPNKLQGRVTRFLNRP